MADALSSVFHHVGWMFLPSYGSSILQSLFYSLSLRAGQRRPQPGDPLHELHRRRCHVLFLILYLIYTLAQALYDIKLVPDFYTILGVSISAPDREVKAKFRRLAARLHPDKLPQNAGAAEALADAAFVQLKLAQDTLLSPAKRFAYDRFGPAIIQYTPHPNERLHTKRDFVYAGLRSLFPEYIRGGISLILLNYFWFPKYGQFWRYFAILVLAFLEITLLTHEWSPSPALSLAGTTLHDLLPGLLPTHLLPFQVLTVARRMSISINIFISQLTPRKASANAMMQSRQNDLLLSHLSQAVARVDQEASGLVSLGFAPYRGDREMVERLRGSMTEGMSLGAVRQSPDVKEAVGRVLDRRKRDGPRTDIDELG